MTIYSSQATETNLENTRKSSKSDTEECEESSVAEYEDQYSTTPNYKTSHAGKIAEIIGHTPKLTAFDELRYQLKDGYKEMKVSWMHEMITISY